MRWRRPRRARHWWRGSTRRHGRAGSPAPGWTLHSPIAERLEGASALEVEDWLRRALAAARPADAAAGAASLGAHRADMGLADLATGLPAGHASTGQQKALLIGVILAHAALLEGARGTAPLLLLDEAAVHLGRRAAGGAVRGAGGLLRAGVPDRDGRRRVRAAGWARRAAAHRGGAALGVRWLRRTRARAIDKCILPIHPGASNRHV